MVFVADDELRVGKALHSLLSPYGGPCRGIQPRHSSSPRSKLSHGQPLIHDTPADLSAHTFRRLRVDADHHRDSGGVRPGGNVDDIPRPGGFGQCGTLALAAEHRAGNMDASR